MIMNKWTLWRFLFLEKIQVCFYNLHFFISALLKEHLIDPIHQLIDFLNVCLQTARNHLTRWRQAPNHLKSTSCWVNSNQSKAFNQPWWVPKNFINSQAKGRETWTHWNSRKSSSQRSYSITHPTWNHHFWCKISELCQSTLANSSSGRSERL